MALRDKEVDEFLAYFAGLHERDDAPGQNMKDSGKHPPKT
jgi:hypothetical protein